MEVYDENRNLRATIADDGELKDKDGNTVGFINDDGSAGDVNEQFLGSINDDGQVADGSDNLLGQIDMGTAEFRDGNGSYWGKISGSGELYDKFEAFKGKVDYFSYHKLKTITAYLFYFDSVLLDPSGTSKIGPPPEQGAETKQPEEAQETTDLPMPGFNEPPPPAIDLKPPAEPVIESREYKNYRVGEFKTLSGGKQNLLEIYDCDCPDHQLRVRLEKDGKQVVYQRTIQFGNEKKQTVQRFTIPYHLNHSRILVQYNKAREGGTLSITMTKPDPNEGGSSPTSGEFCNFVVPATPGSEGKVTMKAGQFPTFFQFDVQGESKHETEMTGELLDGDSLKFHATTTIREENVKHKATQTFKLPTKIALDHIQCENGGRAVKVFMKKPENDKAGVAAPTLPDSDVYIQVI